MNDNESVALSPTLDQLTLEVKFYLGQTAQNILEVGKRLIQAKEMLPHGEFGNWLEKNFSLSDRTARRFIAVAERFGKMDINVRFQPTQMIALLELPAAETDAFIDEHAAAGNPVEDMTVKKLREEVQQWKSKSEVNAKAVTENERLIADKDRRISQMSFEFNNLQEQKKVVQRQLDAARDQLKNQKPIIQAPADYEQVKRDLANLRGEKSKLQKELAAAVGKVEVPADYHANKKRLAELDAKISQMQEQINAQISAEDYANVAQKLDTILSLINDVLNSKNAGRVILDYERNSPDRYHMILAQFDTFLEIMK